MTRPAMTAVVCDDEPVKRRAVAETLVRAGCELVVQTSTLAALRRLVRETSPPIIVLDLALAGMSGLEVVRELHASCEACAIVVLTPFTVLRDDAIAAGARGLIDANDLRDLEGLLRSLTGVPRSVDLDPTTIRLDAPPAQVEPPGT